MEEWQRIERTVFKTYRKSIWQPFVGAVKEYGLIREGDRIAICISGGKDSFLLAKCMQLLCRHSDFPFELVFLCMDPGYTPEDRARLVQLGDDLQLPLLIKDVPLFRVVSEETHGSPCYLCARMRRGWLYKLAAEQGCNKIALGHHRDDVVETALMSMLYGAEIKTMMPKLHAENYNGMELIRPLYAVSEHAVKLWQTNSGLTFLHSGCPLHEEGCSGSKRAQTKSLIALIKQQIPDADGQLFRSLHNVNLGMVPGYRLSDGEPVVPFTATYKEVPNDGGTL